MIHGLIAGDGARSVINLCRFAPKPLRLFLVCDQRDALLLAARRAVGLAAICVRSDTLLLRSETAEAISCLPSAYCLVACCSARGRPHSYLCSSEFMSLRSKPLKLSFFCHQRDALLLASARGRPHYFMNTVGSTDMPGRN